jgi:hypothetical protein
MGNTTNKEKKDFFEMKRPTSNLDQYSSNSFRGKKTSVMIDMRFHPNTLSAENLHTPKVVDMPCSKDYFYDNEAMLKMPIA